MPDRSFELARLRKIDTSKVGPFVRQRNKPRDIPPALEAHPVFRVDDPASAARLTEWLIGPHRLHPLERDAFQAALYAVKIRDITMAHLEFSCPTDIVSSGWTKDTTVFMPSAGTSTLIHREHALDLSPIVGTIPMAESVPILRCYAKTAHLVVRFDEGALTRYLSRLLGRSIEEPLRFGLTFELSESRASRWNLALQALHGELFDDRSLLHQGDGVSELEEFLMSSLLHSCHHNYSEELASGAKSGNRVLRAGCRFIEENLRSDLGVDHIAEAAGVSARTLQSVFRSDLGTTPMSYVRDRRLERVRAELADADAAHPPTVSAVAHSWGFSHLGRFSRAYRERFGEAPSETLRQ